MLDAGGHALVVKRDERSSIGRVEIAVGKAHGCLAMGFGGRELARRADAVPQFFVALSSVLPKGIVPVPGGVLVRDTNGAVLGAVGSQRRHVRQRRDLRDRRASARPASSPTPEIQR